MKIQVEITETLSKIVEIEANTEEEALQIANEMYQEEEIVLDENDYIDTKIKIFFGD